MTNSSLHRTASAEQIAPVLMKALGCKSIMQLPRLEKICINRGVGEAVQDKKKLEIACQELSIIAGQKAVPTKAKKAVSNFKLREGMAIGARVTLRGAKMYEFIGRLVHLVLPRVRDFRGLPRRGFDGRGNYTLGVREQTIFPEISIDKTEKICGMNIVFVSNASTDTEMYQLLKALGMPFKG